jgi:hypothetical protein
MLPEPTEIGAESLVASADAETLEGSWLGKRKEIKR